MSNRKKAKGLPGRLVREQLKRYRRGAQQMAAERKSRQSAPAIDAETVKAAMRTIEEHGRAISIEDRRLRCRR